MQNIKVQCRAWTDLKICSDSIRECWDSFNFSDSGGPKDINLIDKVGNKFKHKSTLEHLVFNFRIEGISRACLQELARHRIASLSVKSTRYTLGKLKNYSSFFESDHNTLPVFEGFEEFKTLNVSPYEFIIKTESEEVNVVNIQALENLRILISKNIKNDYVKYAIPESFRTSLSYTINARSLQNLLELRTSNKALKEFQILAHKIFESIPESHKYIFQDSLQFKS